jgi:hypothetical protein
MKIIFTLLGVFLMVFLNFSNAETKNDTSESAIDNIDYSFLNSCKKEFLSLNNDNAVGNTQLIKGTIPERIKQVHANWNLASFLCKWVYIFLTTASIICGTIASSNLTKDLENKKPWKTIFITIATILTTLNTSFNPERYWHRYEEAGVMLHLAMASYEATMPNSDICPVIFAAYNGEKIIHAK